jgi:hypothetical protein
MAPFSYAKALLRHWSVSVDDIPTSDAEKKKEADFLATFDGARVLIEEKTKEDDPAYLAHGERSWSAAKYTRQLCPSAATKHCPALSGKPQSS